MKNLIILLVLGFTFNLSAQQKKIITKRIDSNSTMIEEDDDNSKVKFEVKTELVNGNELTTYTLEKVKNGKKTITHWDGEGEAPKEIKEQIQKSEAIDVNSEDVEIISENEYEIEIEDNGKKKIMKWNGEGEMPEEMKNTIEEHDIELDVEEGSHVTKKVIMKKSTSSKYDVNVKMGIGLRSNDAGVSVEYVEDNSPASEAGIKTDDTILKINDAYIFTDESLMKELAKYNPGDKVKVTVLRDETEKTLKMTLVAI